MNPLEYRILYDREDEFLAVCKDFNEMAVRLKQSVDGMQRQEQSRKELVAGISHDLRSPLTSIQAYVEGLLDGVAQTPEAQQRYLETIKGKAEDLAQYERLSGTGKPPSEIMLGTIRLNTGTHRVFVEDREVELKNREYELLLFLMLNVDIVFSRETLYEKVWGLEALGDNATVAVHINRLREKLEKDPAHPRYIETVWGAGYRFRG